MSTPFQFLPRIVVKHAKPWHGISTFSPSPSPDPTTDDQDSDPDLAPSTSESKGKERVSEHKRSTEDIAALVSLALSDYNIWLDPDLRWKLDACLGDEVGPDDAAFVPVNYLLRRAPFRGSLPRTNLPEPSETEVVKALRMHASHTLQVRMRLPSPSASTSSVWYGTGKTSRKKDVGGYEVRRRDWPTLRDRPSRDWPRARWDDLTTYLEGIPPQYRTIGGIARFSVMLLSGPSDMEPHIQNVTLPPHYLDKPGDTPKCKGYALITFSTKSHLNAMLHAWPWKRRHTPVSADEDNDHNEIVSPVANEALKYGLRAISKARWDTLNEEYLTYKQHLVDQIARSQNGTHHPEEDTIEAETARDEPDMQPLQPAPVQTTPTSPYPFGCLIFVRHIHPETNKTTLKSLFGQAFPNNSGGPSVTAGLDYVDFTKGMDTCYLRLTSPSHATRLTAYFDAQPKTQADGLDARGCTPVDGNAKPITIELVQGKREELYWDKVPEKVRYQAVDRAIEAQRRAMGAAGDSSSISTVAGMQMNTTFRNGECERESRGKRRRTRV